MSPETGFHTFVLPLLDGGSLPLASLRGRHVLMVNVASYCGYTPQYRSLEELHEQFADKVAVIGLPCNDFGHQEPGNAEEIRSFCDQKYGITFPLTAKVHILSTPIDPVYAWLTRKSENGVADFPVTWNFTKFLISPEGEWLAGFPPAVSPFSEEILAGIGIH